MAKPKVFATHGLFEPARKILEESCAVEYWTQAERPPRPELMQRVRRAAEERLRQLQVDAVPAIA